MKSSGQKMVAEVPMLDLSRQYASIRSEVLEAVERVCDSQSYILGPEVAALEREFATLCGTAESVACNSGTDALWLGVAAPGPCSSISIPKPSTSIRRKLKPA